MKNLKRPDVKETNQMKLRNRIAILEDQVSLTESWRSASESVLEVAENVLGVENIVAMSGLLQNVRKQPRTVD